MTSAFSEIRVLVVGDAMLDRYFDGAVESLSPEVSIGEKLPTPEETRPSGAPASP